MRKGLLLSLFLSLLVGTGVVQAAEVVINEVFYDSPWTPETDHEWIELYNTTSAAIGVGGWILADDPDTSDPHEGYYVIPPGTSIPASGYMVLCRNKDSLTSRWGAAIPGGTQVLEYGGLSPANSLQLANGGDDLHLYDAALAEVDRVWYGDGGDVGSSDAAPDVAAGHSIGRYPNGIDSGNCSSDFRDYTEPTPGRPNPAAVGLSPATWGKIKAMFSVAPGQRKS